MNGPAGSENSGNEDPSALRVVGEALAVPSMVGNGAWSEVAESEEGEGKACQ